MQGLRVCCKPYYIKNEMLEEAQSKILEYKNYFFPYDQIREHQLKKIICGMLNTEGGYILLGILQTPEMKRIVVGQNYSETLKENVNKYFRALGKFIKSGNSSMVDLLTAEFVPIKDKTGQAFIKGEYLIRLRIGRGDKKVLYFFSQYNQDFYYKRTVNQTYRLSTQDALDQFRKKIERLDKDIKQPQSQIHNGKCQPCHLGEQDYTKSTLEQQLPRDIQKGSPSKANQKNQPTSINGINSPQTTATYNPSAKGSQHTSLMKQVIKPTSDPHSGQQEYVYWVLINFCQYDITAIFINKPASVMYLLSKVADVAIVRVGQSYSKTFKQKFDLYKKTYQTDALLIKTSKNLRFQNTGLRADRIMKEASRVCKQNNQPAPEYDSQSAELTCANTHIASRIFMKFREMGKNPRFRNY